MNEEPRKRPDSNGPDTEQPTEHDPFRDDALPDDAGAAEEAADAADGDAGGSADQDPPGGDEAERGASGGDELVRVREAMLRMQAEMDNREKRLEREMVKTRKFAIERLVSDLIPVLDSMDQALAATGGGDAPGSEGLELTRKQALKVLTGHGLDVLDPVGEAFDPTWHEAIATQPSEDQPPDTVLQVLQKGYRLNDRLVRPARVIVAKAS